MTWRISPVNERLHAMSKHFPGMIKVLAESSRLNSMNFQQCSQKKVHVSRFYVGLVLLAVLFIAHIGRCLLLLVSQGI